MPKRYENPDIARKKKDMKQNPDPFGNVECPHQALRSAIKKKKGRQYKRFLKKEIDYER